MVTRRDALTSTAAAIAGGALILGKSKPAQAGQGDATGQGWNKSYSGGPPDVRPQAPGEPGRDYSPTITPNGATLPFTVVEGVKVFHLAAEEVAHEFAPGLKANCRGYNGRVHGPTIENDDPAIVAHLGQCMLHPPLPLHSFLPEQPFEAVLQPPFPKRDDLALSFMDAEGLPGPSLRHTLELEKTICGSHGGEIPRLASSASTTLQRPVSLPS